MVGVEEDLVEEHTKINPITAKEEEVIIVTEVDVIPITEVGVMQIMTGCVSGVAVLIILWRTVLSLT